MAHFHDASQARVDACQPGQGFVDIDHLFAGRRDPGAELGVQRPVRGIAAAPTRARAAGRIDDDRAHHRGGAGQEVRAVAGRQGVALHQLQVALVDERRRVQRAVAGMARQPPMRGAAQFGIHQVEDAIERGAIAVARPRDQLRDFSHACTPVALPTLRTW